MIKSTDLDNRAEVGERQPRRPARPPEADLAERLDAARALAPPAGACRACYMAGRDRAVAVLADEAGELADRVRAAYALQPKHAHVGDTSFRIGRDAAIAAAVTGA
jgi:hypothetical protein